MLKLIYYKNFFKFKYLFTKKIIDFVGVKNCVNNCFNVLFQNFPLIINNLRNKKQITWLNSILIASFSIYKIKLF